MNYTSYGISIDNYNYKITDYIINVEIKLNNIIYVFKNPVLLHNTLEYPVLKYTVNRLNNKTVNMYIYPIVFIDKTKLRITLYCDSDYTTIN